MQLHFHSLIFLFTAITFVIGSKDSTSSIKSHTLPHFNSSRWFWNFAPFEFSIFPYFGPLASKSTSQSSLTKITQKPREPAVSTTNRMSTSDATTRITENTNDAETEESNTNSDNIVNDDVDEEVTSPTEETINDTGDTENFSDNDASTGPDTEESDVEQEMNTGDIIEGDI